MKSNIQRCDVCNRDTLWEKMRGGRERCTVCKRNIFPCRVSCDHFDCREARGELKPDAQGVLQEVHA